MKPEEVKEILLQLRDIAKELNLEFTNLDVAHELTKRRGGVSNEIMDYVIYPIYITPDMTYYGVKMVDGKVVARKKYKDSEWIKVED